MYNFILPVLVRDIPERRDDSWEQTSGLPRIVWMTARKERQIVSKASLASNGLERTTNNFAGVILTVLTGPYHSLSIVVSDKPTSSVVVKMHSLKCCFVTCLWPLTVLVRP